VLTARELHLEPNAEIPTWFGIGGRADRLARPVTLDDLRRCLDLDADLLVLGDGANLLVDDPGVSQLVVALTSPAFTSVAWHDHGRVTAGAGASLPKLITESVRRGLTGLEGLGGIPATLGGAAVMNAGGSFGQIADAVSRVHGLDRSGRSVTLERPDIAFSYRHSGLNHLLVTSVELALHPADPKPLRERLKEVMAYKSGTQPMSAKCAGCCYKNPIVPRDLADRLIGTAPELSPSANSNGTIRLSAGLILDRAGCKGLSLGGATISDHHANFFYVRPGARARDVIQLMELAEKKVLDAFGIRLEREVVVWTRS
jgi:UDP-N-acetylmuramate dehydrogenase